MCESRRLRSQSRKDELEMNGNMEQPPSISPPASTRGMRMRRNKIARIVSPGINQATPSLVISQAGDGNEGTGISIDTNEGSDQTNRPNTAPPPASNNDGTPQIAICSEDSSPAPSDGRTACPFCGKLYKG